MLSKTSKAEYFELLLTGDTPIEAAFPLMEKQCRYPKIIDVSMLIDPIDDGTSLVSIVYMEGCLARS